VVCHGFVSQAGSRGSGGRSSSGDCSGLRNRRVGHRARQRADRPGDKLPNRDNTPPFLILHKELDADDGELTRTRKVPVGQLAYGLQKRVELGRALAMEPELLSLDEPMAGMNVEEKEDMCRFILDINDEFGTTIALIGSVSVLV
jgi:ABC-type glutathione transport system ATPase component